ncbi:type II toxin-antitoxin system HicA family toxin [Pseudonocardia sp. ICBG162]|uniref:type II toxin-antitoxin system HicA family toxin n=1 Tax=Pseudonocardia sp. ICBG162 TaxID=2846761 RepID=UPI001CF6E63B|nr:type II toxin-antitoxin system HicA family toxin [Pseudonocardia sp. ICBG162]
MVKVSEVLRLLAEDGWTLKNQRGSHRQYVHPTKPGEVTVAGKSSVDVLRGTASSILKQAGLKSTSQPTENRRGSGR